MRIHVTRLQKLRREWLKGLSRACLKSARVQVCGRMFHVPLVWGHGALHLVDNDPWIARCFQALLPERPGAVYDVGTHMGTSCLKAYAADPEKPYIGFEPSAYALMYMRELFQLNGMQDACVLPYALADRGGTATLFGNRRDAGTNSIDMRTDVAPRDYFRQTVPLVCGDDAVSMHALMQPAVIKIDVEGAEAAVLRGFRTTITTHMPFLICEMLPCCDGSGTVVDVAQAQRLAALYEILGEFGYVVLGMRKDGTESVRLQSAHAHTPEYFSDCICVPHSSISAVQKRIYTVIQTI